MNILVIEDNPDHFELISRSVDRGLGGDNVIAHRNNLTGGLEALAEDNPLDIILLDLGLPDSNGPNETFTTLNKKNTDVPVVVLTSLHDDTLANDLLNEGAQDFLSKESLTDPGLVARSIRYAIERKKFQLSLKKSNEELSQFAYIASHDLQAPLRHITSFVEILREELADVTLNENSQHAMNFISAGADKMKSLINDLLSYSRTGSDALNFTETNCEELVRDVLVYFTESIKELGANIEVSTLPPITCDSFLMRQLFQNILENAFKYRSEDRTLEIKIDCTEKPHEWEFSVQDNGIGISPEQSEKIFQVFQRLHTSNEYSGNGIGLSICKKIIDLHAGKICVTSDTSPHGCSFHFTISKNIGLKV